MTEEFYKGMLHAMESAKSYAQVVKKSYEVNKDLTDIKELSAYEQGGAAAMRKMIEYFDIFIDFLQVYKDDSTTV